LLVGHCRQNDVCAADIPMVNSALFSFWLRPAALVAATIRGHGEKSERKMLAEVVTCLRGRRTQP
jgi:hypothetical protein